MLVLGIETSCDETAAAVVRDGREVLSNVIYSQIARHQAFGGVVPEIASRAHVEVLPRIIDEAMAGAGAAWGDLDAVAATRGPGLSTSLLVGFTAAKALALRLGKPLLGINHLEAHLYSVFLSSALQPPTSVFRPPSSVLILLASGGHTSLAVFHAPGQIGILGQTFDDAAGEALDKGAKLLGLGYPGGPAIETAARGGNPGAVPFPRGLRSRGDDPETRYAFSFSGLKTALLYHLKANPLDGNSARLADLAASYQEAVVDALVARVERACDEFQIRGLGCAGGVARNRRLREKLERIAAQRNLPLLLAEPDFCTDNAAMVAALAAADDNIARHDATGLDVDPTWPIPSSSTRPGP